MHEGCPDLLAEYLGTPYTMERLSGVGGSGCHVARGPLGEAVLKCDLPPREEYFYREWAPLLRRKGLATPELLASGADPSWVLLERLPATLSSERWQGDSEVVAYLARWHQTSVELLNDANMGYVYAWDHSVLEELSGFIDAKTLEQIGSVIDRHRTEFQSLFEPLTWIHGDPNPTNWLVTASGDLALIDWSRYGRAHPAIDLAISLAGLPDWDVIRNLAQQYRVVNPDLVKHSHPLDQAIALGKLWTAIDFFVMGQRGALSADGNQGLEMLQMRLAPWLRSLFE